MLGRAMRPNPINVPQINREREERAEHANGIAAVKREVGKQEQRTSSAAFPETDRNNALLRALRRDPLNEKARTENHVARPSNEFPRCDDDAEESRLGERMEPV